LAKWRRARGSLSREGTTLVCWVNGRHWVLVGQRRSGYTAWYRINNGAREYAVEVQTLPEVFTMVKKRQPSAEASNASHVAPVESVLFGKLHPLVAHCAATRYDTGEARKPGWWTVKTMGAAWVIEIKCPDTCQRMVVVQQTLDDALALASLLLESEEAPWEPDPWLSAAAAKNKKK